MKYRVGACALMFVLAGCSGEGPDSSLASMRGSAATGTDAKLAVSLPASRASGKSIASAPDRGALVSYANKGAAAKREGAYSYFPVAISEEHAIKAILTGEMTVPSPDGSQVKLRYERHKEEVDGNWTWVGRVVNGDKMQEAIITFGEKAVYGSIPQANGKPPLSLQTRQGSLWAVEVDPSKAASGNTGHTDMMVRPAAALRTSLGAATMQSATPKQAATAVTQAAPPTASNTVDVAIGYTPEFATANGGTSAATTRLVYLIQIGNQAFTNSQINGYLRLVQVVQVSYTNTNTNQTALTELTGSNGSSPVTIPASLVPLRTARDQYGADIAVLVRKFNTPENEGCGIAWLNGAGQTAITSADAAFGYAVVSDGTDQGTDGKTYYCAEETLVHEAAHIMGSAHDRDNSKTSTGALQYGRFAYSFGMKTSSANGNFYTVMAYGDTGQTPYRVFSNPNITTCGGRACGLADQTDNARSLSQTIPVVTTFRATVVPVGSIPNDYDGDGRSDLYWRNSSTGNNDVWFLNGAALVSSATVFRDADQNWVVAGSGDFNADGRADVLWRNSSTGQTRIQHMNGPNVLATSGNSLTVSDQNWKIVAIADFDGDGASDIYWRNAVSGYNDLWLMGALVPRASASVYRETSQAWQVVGSGDFNGDGFADIFWRNATTGQNCIHLMNGTSIIGAAFTDTVNDTNWKVAAIRDFNRDGRADIYWHNDASGMNYLWTMNGTQVATVSFVHYEADQNWKILNSGDYNGDGYYDILWRNVVTGQNLVHMMNGPSVIAAGQLNRVSDLNWKITGR
jgi:hypothetical protein